MLISMIAANSSAVSINIPIVTSIITVHVIGNQVLHVGRELLASGPCAPTLPNQSRNSQVAASGPSMDLSECQLLVTLTWRPQ